MPLCLLTSRLSLAFGVDIDTKYRQLSFNQPNLIGEVIARIHSGCDVIPWEGRCDLIVYGSAQFGSGMWYLREDGKWDGERLFVPTQFKEYLWLS